jgi:hypothetical protein
MNVSSSYLKVLAPFPLGNHADSAAMILQFTSLSLRLDGLSGCI